ncbi:glycosyltransferase family 4 protein [Pontibacter actiniarum]|uniref:Group 1 glycosyl transferase n=1 Tax=Pontibacter actiniarum TaxID=323450 RepID=A0A1X9YNP7_9BACT|nr:glycosyltransferase family 4 protein [Pontibacter actiniarum]ARS34505.1 group 1 glycosyl transferase [Pontibacter actiniarum]
MVIGVSGPVDIDLLECDFGNAPIPSTNAFPLVSHFINGLIKRGHHVVVYTNSGELTEPTVIRSKQVTLCICPTKPQPGRRFFKFEREQLEAIIRQNPSDVIYAYWTYEYAWAAIESGIPTVVSVHDNAFKILLNQPDMFRLVRYLMNVVVLHKAQWLVANSAYTFRNLSASSKKKAVVINNFFSPHLGQLIPEGTPKENYITSVVNGFTKRKGIPKALHAFARLREKFPELEYHLLGVDMEPGGAAQQYAQQHNLQEGVRFLGPASQAELMQHMAKAKVLLHPSVEESFGMAVLESMLAHTPVVGGKRSGFVPYLLNHGDAGVLCDVTSAAAMATAVEKLLLDRELSGQVAKKANAFAKANFSEEVVINKHLDIFKSILNIGNTYPPMLAKEKAEGYLFNT